MPATYDKFATYYDDAFAWFEGRFLDAWRMETLALLPDDSAILELGAGTGANFVHYPRSRIVVSTEISAGMIRIARPKAAGNLLVQADAQSLPFDTSSFDAAFATLVFCSVPDPAAAFQEVNRVVRPGGRVVLLEHVRPRGLKGRLFDMLNVLTVALIDDHFNRRTSDIARSAGLNVTEIREKAGGAVNLIVCEVVK